MRILDRRALRWNLPPPVRQRSTGLRGPSWSTFKSCLGRRPSSSGRVVRTPVEGARLDYCAGRCNISSIPYISGVVRGRSQHVVGAPPSSRHSGSDHDASASHARRRGGSMVSGPGGFAGDFVAALADDFAEHGAAAIAELRQRNPNAYLRLCASVLRHKAANSDPLEALTDAQLAARRDAIAARLAAAGERPHLADAAAAAPRPRRVVAKDAVGEPTRERATRPPATTGVEGAGGKEPGGDLAPPLSRDLGRRREDRPAQRRGDDPGATPLAPVRAAGRPGRGARLDAGPPARHERPAGGEPERVGNGRRPDVPHAGAPPAGIGCARPGGPREADRRNGAGATPRRPGASVAVRLSAFAIVVATLLGIAAPAAAPTPDVTAEEERRIAPWEPAACA